MSGEQVCYNLAAVLEATGELEEAMVAFERAQKLGIDRAQINVRNVSTSTHFAPRIREELGEETDSFASC